MAVAYWVEQMGKDDRKARKEHKDRVMRSGDREVLRRCWGKLAWDRRGETSGLHRLGKGLLGILGPPLDPFVVDVEELLQRDDQQRGDLLSKIIALAENASVLSDEVAAAGLAGLRHM